MFLNLKFITTTVVCAVIEFIPRREPPMLDSLKPAPALLLPASCEAVETHEVAASDVVPFDAIDRLGALEVGWDGEDAPPPNDRAIACAKVHLARFVQHGLRPDEVDADVLGGVGVIFIGRDPSRRGWLATMNSGASTLVLSDGEGDVRTMKIDRDLPWPDVVKFLG